MIFPLMLEELRKTGRGGWLDQEMERICDPANYLSDPQEAWKRGASPAASPEVLGRLKALVAWREREAQDKNLPRGRIVRMRRWPIWPAIRRAQDDLVKVRGLSAARRSNDIGSRLMSAVANAQTAVEGGNARARQQPSGPGQGRRAGRRPAETAAKDPGAGNRCCAAPAGAQRRSGGAGSRGAGRAVNPAGWRFEQFGRDALDLVEGRLAFAVNGRQAEDDTDGGRLMRIAMMIATLPALALAGCMATGESAPAGPPALTGECKADTLGKLHRAKATVEVGAAMLKASGARTLRWVPPHRRHHGFPRRSADRQPRRRPGNRAGKLRLTKPRLAPFLRRPLVTGDSP